jgi:pseudouridine-5'-phosphate glycosidase
MLDLVNRAGPAHVALETTLLLHGVPRDAAIALADNLEQDVRAAGAHPALMGVVDGRPVAGMTRDELNRLLASDQVPKANLSNLGVILHRKGHAATTVSTTMQLAAAAGVRVFATGGLGGVHRGFAEHLDISSDLAAMTRFPVAVVAAGVKSILDVEATREALETLGVPVVGFRTDQFPAFYRRWSAAGVDARFDDVPELARYLKAELARSGRGILVANPVAPEHEIPEAALAGWISTATDSARRQGISGRGITPHVLGQLHHVSGGVTLRCNVELVRSNARLAGELCAAMGRC